MMPVSSPRKNKINLADYSYKRDIENRLLMAHWSAFEVDVLREILHHSLTITIKQLADALEADLEAVNQALEKLSVTKLFKKTSSTLTVDKEMRKYYETQIDKFDDDFEPNMEFLQGLLNKIPIHVLPNWYAIPRHSDNIFNSIIEKYFYTPKIYRQYLEEIQFDHPVLLQIVKDLHEAPNFKLFASDVMTKYNLSREQFEEYLLLLEYHFIGCLSYNQVDDVWEEVITPFYEWWEYLIVESHSKPKAIKSKNEVEQITPSEFGFIIDMQTILKGCNRKKINSKAVSSLFNKTNKPQDYLEHLLFKLEQLEFITWNKDVLEVTDKGAIWLAKTTQEQAITLANHPLNTLKGFSSNLLLCSTRNFRQVEKGLRKLTEKEWVYLNDFVEGFIVPLTNKNPIVLINKGKRWKYAFPIYTTEEQDFIKAVVIERLFELGFVAKGIHQNQICIALTPFGRQMVG